MPVARHDHGCVANDDGVVFVFGGMMGYDEFDEPLWDTYQLGADGEWLCGPLQPLIEGRGGFASCLLKDTAIVSGGTGLSR